MSDTAIFTEVRQHSLPRNKFDMSFDNKMSGKFGTLMPMLCQELMPGDEVQHNHEVYIQFAPLNSQMMHRFYAKTEYFFVPCRLVYEKFNDFLVGGPDGTSIVTPPCVSVKQLRLNGQFSPSSLSDYLGALPSTGTYGSHNDDRLLNSMPYRAYQLIYNDWYRDENLITDLEIPKIGGQELDADIPMLTTLRKRAWRKDYFTSALPWPQKGPQVNIPLGDVAYVYPYAIDSSAGASFSPSQGTLGKQPLDLQGYTPTFGLNAEPGTENVSFDKNTTFGQTNIEAANNFKAAFATQNENGDPSIVGLVADLRAATATSIDELRRAYAVQAWLELNAVGGTRDVEQIYNHFGVHVPDYRLGRPEYIAGYSNQISIGNVYSTNSNDDNNGNIQAEAVSVANGSYDSETFTYYAHEHGYLIGIISFMPKAGYYQGIPRMFGRRMDKFDYYWPEFAELGEQPIYSEEIYLNNNDETVFGYTPRYAEFKFADDQVHGDFRTTLNFHHDVPILTGEPSLNQTFIEIDGTNQNLNRIFNAQVEGSDNIYIDIYHNISKISSMVYFGNPKIL